MTPLHRLSAPRWAALAGLALAGLIAARWVFRLDFGNLLPGLSETSIVAAVLLFIGSATAWVMAGWPRGQAPGVTARAPATTAPGWRPRSALPRRAADPRNRPA